MAQLPSATTTISEAAAAGAEGLTSLLAIWAPVKTNADLVPRLYSNPEALLTQHGYSRAADYVAMHVSETGKPVLFQGLPIVTQGVLGRFNTSGNTGTSVASISAGGSGPLEETDGVLKVAKGGTIGTDQIQLELSLDGGRTYKQVRLGTANSYAIPYVDLTLNFAAGTLVAGDTVLTWYSSAPRVDQAGLAAARAAL
ncbi:MAG TPA: hypothetical protein VFT98_22030, partial [Myxococcota bacterium]|nr:hypothetical protein [Myxococcota bacterium]